jgi:hypothetical protein
MGKVSEFNPYVTVYPFMEKANSMPLFQKRGPIFSRFKQLIRIGEMERRSCRGQITAERKADYFNPPLKGSC